MSRVPDGCLVPTEPLASMLRSFFAEWNRVRPPTGGRFSQAGDEEAVTPVRAAEWLSTTASLSESTIQNIVDQRYRMTELRIADALVNALGFPQAWHDGTLTIHPNPSASKAARDACCSGSTSAAA